MAHSDHNSQPGKEFLIEAYQLGDMVKVSAIDPDTGTEVFVVGPAKARFKDLERLALKKLMKRLKPAASAPAPKRGKLI